MLKQWLWLSIAVVVLDQCTKWFAEAFLVAHKPVSILPSFNLALTYNSGAAFGIFADAGGWQRWFFLGMAVTISIVLVLWILRLKPEEKRLAIALSLVLGGAIGNMVDRALFGQVIDFIQLYYDRWYWPTFNIADSAITIGAMLLILDSFYAGKT
ncbi:MAG: signal peptidase II [Candidatus Contendobacter odensis]|uniref:Lipoprotein signal peptidase n=1 Tax=Candidatus Contendibacter odensensis TaxID=1400860 RepID=A0A2G6PEU7_9GAMM|nr:MAG: signal peptidase II [Candidatus Contendobacter odensis]